MHFSLYDYLALSLDQRSHMGTHREGVKKGVEGRGEGGKGNIQTQTDTDRHRQTQKQTHRDTHRDTHRHVYSHRETRESMLCCVPLQG